MTKISMRPMKGGTTLSKIRHVLLLQGNLVMGRNETSCQKNDMTGLKLTNDCWPTASPGNFPSGLTQIENNNQDENQ